MVQVLRKVAYLSKKQSLSSTVSLNPKFRGIHLLRLLPKAYFVGMGSIAGRFGNAGQIDYSAANDALSHVLSRRGNALHISWSAWGDTGMAVRAGMDRVLRDKGIEFYPLFKHRNYWLT